VEEEDDDNPNGNDKNTEREREREEYIHECAECKSVGVTHQPPTSIRSDPSGRHTHTTWQHSAHRLDLLSNDLCRGIVAQLNFLSFSPFPHLTHVLSQWNGEAQKSLKSLAASPFFLFLCSPTSFLLHSANAALFPEIRLTRLAYILLPPFSFLLLYLHYTRVVSPPKEKMLTPGEITIRHKHKKEKKSNLLLESWLAGAPFYVFSFIFFFSFGPSFKTIHHTQEWRESA
jgi:hypothetical protein